MTYLEGVVRSAIIAMTHCDDETTTLLLNLPSVTGTYRACVDLSKLTDLSLAILTVTIGLLSRSFVSLFILLKLVSIENTGYIMHNGYIILWNAE